MIFLTHVYDSPLTSFSRMMTPSRPLACFCLCMTLGALGANVAAEELFGDWSLKLQSGTPAWMSVRDSEAGPIVKLRLHVGPDGPHRDVQYSEGKLTFTLRQNKKQKDTKRVELELREEQLEGRLIAIAEDGSTSIDPLTGHRIPPPPTMPPDLSKVHFGHPILLFNGKDLTGWRPHESDKINGWSAQDGMLVNTTPKTDFSATGAYANLRTEAVFEDFWLHIEFLVEKDRNSGVYLRGMYEAQVVDRDSRMQGIQGVGAIFGSIAPEQERWS